MVTEIERKVLALVNEVAGYDYIHPRDMNDKCFMLKALCRAIEQHEAFRQEVSDVISELSFEYTSMGSYYADKLKRFIIAKPDPLTGVIEEIEAWPPTPDQLRAAIEKRGGKIVWEDK